MSNMVVIRFDKVKNPAGNLRARAGIGPKAGPNQAPVSGTQRFRAMLARFRRVSTTIRNCEIAQPRFYSPVCKVWAAPTGRKPLPTSGPLHGPPVYGNVAPKPSFYTSGRLRRPTFRPSEATCWISSRLPSGGAPQTRSRATDPQVVHNWVFRFL
jgi:hypothetical protein